MTNPRCIEFMYICTDKSYIFRKREDYFTIATGSDWITIAHPMSALSWLIVSVFELLLFILVVRKAKYQFWYKRGPKEVPITRDIMEVMAKDSTNYFIMWVYTSKRIKICTDSSISTSLFSVGAIGTLVSLVSEVGTFKSPLDGRKPYVCWILL